MTEDEIDFTVANPWSPYEVRQMDAHLIAFHAGAYAPLLTFGPDACDECWRIAERAANLADLRVTGEEVRPQQIIDAFYWAAERDKRNREREEARRTARKFLRMNLDPLDNTGKLRYS